MLRGYNYDHETGLYYLQSRYYDPEIGRFINADGYASTGQGILGNNMFSYCGNNPVNMMDPTGYLAISNTRQFFVVMALGVTLATVVRPNADKVVDGFRDIIDVISERIVELFDTPLTLTPDELTGIAKGYEVGECLQAAEAMQKKNGNRGHIIHLYFPNAHNGYVCSERYPSFAISTNGNHYGYLYENIVYCNIYPEGREQSMWVNSFYDVTGAVPIVNIY